MADVMQKGLKQTFAEAHGPVQRAVGVVFQARNPKTNKIEVLMMTRGSVYQKGQLGLLGLIGGEVDPGESDMQAAVRETYEELGLSEIIMNVFREIGVEEENVNALFQKLLKTSEENEDGDVMVERFFRKEIGIKLDINATKRISSLLNSIQFIQQSMENADIQNIHQEVLRPDNPDWWQSANNVYSCVLDWEQFERLNQIAKQNESQIRELSHNEVGRFERLELESLVKKLNAGQDMSMKYETNALIKLGYIRGITRLSITLPYLNEFELRKSDKKRFRVLDTDALLKMVEQNGQPLTGYKHAARMITVAKGGEVIVTKSSDSSDHQNSEPVKANAGDLIFTNMTFDEKGDYVATQDSWIPSHENGVRFNASDLKKLGYEKISEDEGDNGLYIRSAEVGREIVLPYVVKEPTLIKDAYGKGRDAYVEVGGTIKINPEGKVTGTDPDPFSRTWSIERPKS